MKPIILNSSNCVANTNNSLYTFNFSRAQTFKHTDSLALSNISIYNSSFNISAKQNNNQLNLIFNSATPITINCVIPDGYYSVNDMNNYLQSKMIANNLYCINASLQNVYFCELVIAPTAYKAQINFYPIPTTSQATTLQYTKPIGATWNFPSSASCPQLSILSVAFGNLIGFSVATFPPTVLSSQISYQSTFTPQISPVSNYLLGCNLLNSDIAFPNNIFYSVPLTTSFGSLVVNQPSQLIFNNINRGSYNGISIQLYDQYYNPLILQDNDVIISLVIQTS